MKTRKITKALLFAAITLAGVTLTIAQEEPKSTETPQALGKKTSDAKPDILAQLGLAPEQRQEIRRLNAERKPLMQSAQSRFREANRLLDESIYADVIDESTIADRLREVQAAQSEVQRIRNNSELSIRKILTPEQLVRFRGLRQNFERGRVREELIKRRQNINRRRGNDPTSVPANDQPIRQFLKQKRQR